MGKGKKFLALVMAGMLSLTALAGCGNGDSGQQDSGTPSGGDATSQEEGTSRESGGGREAGAGGLTYNGQDV